MDDIQGKTNAEWAAYLREWADRIWRDSLPEPVAVEAEIASMPLRVGADAIMKEGPFAESGSIPRGEWKSEMPKEPGWYWARRKFDKARKKFAMQPVDVSARDGKNTFDVTCFAGISTMICEKTVCLWEIEIYSIPIRPPEGGLPTEKPAEKPKPSWGPCVECANYEAADEMSDHAHCAKPRPGESLIRDGYDLYPLEQFIIRACFERKERNG